MDVTIRGLTELQEKYAHKGRDIRPMLARTMDKAVKYAQSQVPGYPEPPPFSTYRRTGQLGRALTSEVREIGNASVGVIGNATVYAPDVISSEAVGGRGPQKWYHARTGWYTLQAVVDGAREAIIDIFRKAVKMLVEE